MVKLMSIAGTTSYSRDVAKKESELAEVELHRYFGYPGICSRLRADVA